MVEIFRTNIKLKRDAKNIVKLLNNEFPLYEINFDLEDADRILRIKAEAGKINRGKIEKMVRAENFYCKIINS